MTALGFITGAVNRTSNEGSIAGEQAWRPDLGGGPYDGDATEYIIPNPRATVTDLKCFEFDG